MMKATPRIVYIFSLFFFILPNSLHAEVSPSVLVQTTAVVEQAISETLNVYGTVLPDPDQSISLSLPHGGYITRVWCRLGQRVTKGDKLLEIDASPSARMQFIQAHKDVDFARQELARQQRLVKEQLATRSQVEAAKKTLFNAQTSLDSLQKQGLEESHKTLTAPMDGIVTSLNITQGQRVQAETTAMLIASEDKLIVRLGVEPEDLNFVHPGLPVILSSVFDQSYSVKTTVREIHAMINPDTHLVDVLVDIPTEQVDSLVLGSKMTAQIELVAHKALVVPRSAVLKDTKGDYIFLASTDKAHRVAVTRGIDSRKWVEIKGKVNIGDIVVISGNYELTDGMSIREAK
jgi:RND family efflux transporter MFP subunit